jgi:ATP-binding cassette, subfamily C, bacterial PrsD
VISHRPSALAALDMAMVLYEGKAIAFGSCQEIFARVSGGKPGQAAPAVGKVPPAVTRAAPVATNAAPAVARAAPQQQQIRAAPAPATRPVRRAAPAAENA